MAGTLRRASVMTSFAAGSANISDTIEVQLNTIRAADLLVNGAAIDTESSETNSFNFKGLC